MIVSVPTDAISVQDAAELLGVHRTRVHDFLADGRLQAVWVGGRLLLSRAEVELFATIPRYRGKWLSRIRGKKPRKV